MNADADLLRQTLEINALSPMVILNEAANLFEQQGHGQIVAIGSVAGDRGPGRACLFGTRGAGGMGTCCGMVSSGWDPATG